MSKSALMLIDANFNRFQEGLHVIEDFLRFLKRDFLIRSLEKSVVDIKESAALSGRLLFGRESSLDEGDNTHSIYETEQGLCLKIFSE